ncbi:MAG: isoprenyl transferase [Candidatus Izimaplasma sp.]|nr:isoprenyl transferase [Candidatus Izimaplasma bacterium]
MKLEKRVMSKHIPSHIAIILDGNGRWAQKNKYIRTVGHKIGAENLKNMAIICNEVGIKVLSVYAFSTENWNRPADEVDYLMKLPHEFEESYKGQFKENDIKVIFSGRRDRFSLENIKLINKIEEKTKHRKGLILNVCFDYGSHTEIIEAVKQISELYKQNEIEINEIDKTMIEKHLYTKDLPPLDLLIRTSGELRISNFLLWQLAYSELYFTKKLWPEFKRKELFKALDNFQKRNRRFGAIKEDKK